MLVFNSLRKNVILKKGGNWSKEQALESELEIQKSQMLKQTG
jgi:hypothetical protein